MKKSLELIENLSNANGVSGFEDEVISVVRKRVEDKLKVEEDSMRNLYLYQKDFDPTKPILMLDGHSDEVGFMVKSINKNGTLKFLRMGNWFEQNVPAHKVRIKNRDGYYLKGIVASKPPHFMSEEEQNRMTEIEDMVIDIGSTSKEETIEKYKIEVGAPIIPDVEFEYDAVNKIMMGKAFDNRLGTAAVVDTMLNLRGKDLAVNPVGCLSAQEEVGTRGAEVTARKIKPAAALVFEGTPADDTFRDSYDAQSVLKKGGQIRHRDISVIANPRFVSFARDIAAENAIPFQDAVRSGGGNDGARIALSNYSVPTIIIGVPVRYAHTHYGISAFEDYLNTLNWAEKIIENLDEQKIAHF